MARIKESPPAMAPFTVTWRVRQIHSVYHPSARWTMNRRYCVAAGRGGRLGGSGSPRRGDGSAANSGAADSSWSGAPRPPQIVPSKKGVMISASRPPQNWRLQPLEQLVVHEAPARSPSPADHGWRSRTWSPWLRGVAIPGRKKGCAQGQLK